MWAKTDYDVSSPDGELKLTVSVSDGIYYSVSCRGQEVLKNGTLQMRMGEGASWQQPARGPQGGEAEVNETLHPVVAFKTRNISNHYRELQLKFRSGYAVEFRVYNDGMAYRFLTEKKR